MIFHLIILATTSLFSQVKCRAYAPEKDIVDYNLNRQQTYNPTYDRTYNPTEQREILLDDKGQYPYGWNEKNMKGDRSPIIFTDKAPITINYGGGHSGPEQPPNGFRNSHPIVVTSQGKVTVNYDDSEKDVPSPSNKSICLLTNTTMVELPSGIVMPYLKFKTISRYLPAEDQKSDIQVILDNKNMTYKQFQETLRYYGCGDLQDSNYDTNFVTLSNGTLKVEMDDYRNIVSSIVSGSETLMVPNVVNGKYPLYCSLIADELPELMESAFVITHKGIVVPFSSYYAVDRQRFQRSSKAAVVPKVRQIKWRDGKLVDVQTVRHVIDALRTPKMINFVFPNGKRIPFVRSSVEKPTELYDYDPEKVLVDVGQRQNVLLSHFNDILFAVHIPDDSSSAGKYKRFNHPAVFAWDPKCLNTTSAQPSGGKACKQSNEVDDRKYSGYSIHVINKDKPRIEDKPADKKLTVFGPVSAMGKTSGLDSNDTIRIILTSSSGTHEIKITNVLNNKKPLIYDITDKPINVRDLTKNMSQYDCDYSPVYLMNKTNIFNVTDPVNPQINNNCTNILKNNETNCMMNIQNTPINDSKNQTVTGCNENPTANNNKNQKTDTVTTTIVAQNTTKLMNTTINPRTCVKMNNLTTIETKNNDIENPDCTEKYTKNQQNGSNPVTEDNKMPIINSNNDPTEINNAATKSAPNITAIATGWNDTNTDKNYEPNSNNTVTTETRNNTINDPKNNQNSSNSVIEDNATPIIMTALNNNQTETKNTTTMSAPKSGNTTDSSVTNTDKIYEPNDTNNSTVSTEIKNNNTNYPKNNQNGSNPVNGIYEIPAITNTNHRYQNPTETTNTTASTPNGTENTNGGGSNAGRKYNETFIESNETPSVNSTAETIQTRAPDASGDVGPMENPETIPETNTEIDDDTSPDVHNFTTIRKTETDQPAPTYTETIKSPNNKSVTNNATNIINVIVY